MKAAEFLKNLPARPGEALHVAIDVAEEDGLPDDMAERLPLEVQHGVEFPVRLLHLKIQVRGRTLRTHEQVKLGGLRSVEAADDIAWKKLL